MPSDASNPVNPDGLIGCRVTSPLFYSSSSWGETLLVWNALQVGVVNVLAPPAASQGFWFAPLVLSPSGRDLKDQRDGPAVLALWSRANSSYIFPLFGVELTYTSLSLGTRPSTCYNMFEQIQLKPTVGETFSVYLKWWGPLCKTWNFTEISCVFLVTVQQGLV